MAQFQYPDSGQYWLSVTILVSLMWPNAGSFGSRTQASVFGPILGRHSSHVHAESGNRSRAELFLPACRIWAIIGQTVLATWDYFFLMRLEEFICRMHFHLPLFASTLFCTSQKLPQASVFFFLQIKGFLFKILHFHHSFFMQYFKMHIKIG